MGQGMCSGMRDAWNLAWKLGLILDGKADDRLLDSYEPERHPHVSQITDISIYLGKIICIPDPAEAAARDEAFFSGTAPPPPPFPQLIDGLLHRDPAGNLTPGAGLLSPHDELDDGKTVHRLDELAARGFVVITRGYDAPGEARDALSGLDPAYVRLGEGGVAECNGRLSAMLDAQDWDAMIVRPDFYVYGGARGADALSKISGDLRSDLKSCGVCL
jgi:FAD binding domain